MIYNMFILHKNWLHTDFHLADQLHFLTNSSGLLSEINTMALNISNIFLFHSLCVESVSHYLRALSLPSPQQNKTTPHPNTAYVLTESLLV